MSKMMIKVVSMRMKWFGTGVSMLMMTVVSMLRMLMMTEVEFQMYRVMMSLALAVQKV